MPLEKIEEDAFIQLVIDGRLNDVKPYLEEGADTTPDKALLTEAINTAIIYNQFDVFLCLFEYHGKNPISEYDFRTMINAASEHGRVDVFKQIEKSLQLTPKMLRKISYNKALVKAATNGHLELVNYLLSLNTKQEQDKPKKKSSFKKFFKGLVVSKLRVDYTFILVLERAVASGQIAIVRRLLQLDNPRIDYNTYDNVIFKTATRSGNLEMVNLFLELRKPQVDVNAGHFYAFLISACNGYTDILKRFLTLDQPGSNYSHRNLSALLLACQKGHLKIVDVLLASTNVLQHPKYSNQMSLDHAIVGGNIDIVERLLQLKGERAATAYDLNHALSLATQHGKYHLVERLLNYPIQPKLDNFNALSIACKAGHPSIMHALSEWGYKNGYVELVDSIVGRKPIVVPTQTTVSNNSLDKRESKEETLQRSDDEATYSSSTSYSSDSTDTSSNSSSDSASVKKKKRARL